MCLSELRQSGQYSYAGVQNWLRIRGRRLASSLVALMVLYYQSPPLLWALADIAVASYEGIHVTSDARLN